MRHFFKASALFAVFMFLAVITAKYTAYSMFETLLLLMTALVIVHVTDDERHKRLELVTYEVEYVPEDDEEDDNGEINSEDEPKGRD